MSDTNAWFLNLISELEAHNIGDRGRLDSIREYLQNGKEIYQSDKNYLIAKYAELQKTQQVKPVEISELKIESEIPDEKENDSEQTATNENSEKTDELSELKDQIKNLNEKVKKFESKEENKILEKQITIQEKSLSTTLVLSLVLGLIGIQGVGHMYVNRAGKGATILIISLILFWIGIATFPAGIILLIFYFIIFIWQIFDSRKCCYEYNTKLGRKLRQQ